MDTGHRRAVASTGFAMTADDGGPGSMGRGRSVGLAIVFLWFLIGGIAHFVATDAEMRIVPTYVPWHRAAVLVSGVFELIGVAGLCWRPTRRWAGWLLFAVTIAVTPVHVWMLQTADQWPAVPYWALVARLPLQVVLLVLMVWSTTPTRPVEIAYLSSRRRPGSNFL